MLTVNLDLDSWTNIGLTKLHYINNMWINFSIIFNVLIDIIERLTTMTTIYLKCVDKQN